MTSTGGLCVQLNELTLAEGVHTMSRFSTGNSILRTFKVVQMSRIAWISAGEIPMIASSTSFR